MSNFNWDSFLRRWSQEALTALGQDQSTLPPEAIASGWLGYPGATDEQIAAAEARLGISLPPSYRNFLQVSNGWPQTTPFIYRIWSVEEIDWFPARHQDWIDAFLERHGNEPIDPYNASAPAPSVPDRQYFVYGAEQDCSQIRVEYLHRALEISEKGDSAIYLLNPEIITKEGEWEAWFFCDWLPGADRYPSFQTMMQAEYENFLELRETSAQQIIRLPRNQVNQPEHSGIAGESEEESEDAESEVTTVQPLPIPEGTTEWNEIATFIVEFQSRTIAGRTERQTTAYHPQTNDQSIWNGIATDALKDWMSHQLSEALALDRDVQTPAIADVPIEIPATIEITQLQTFQPPLAETPVNMTSSDRVLSGFVRSNEPFALEIGVRLVKLNKTVGFSQRLTCLAQVFARNLTTGVITHLGDTRSEFLFGKEEVPYRVKLPETSLQSGLYRLQILARLQDTSVTSGYLEIPLLQVL
jgi:hypothetical protein